METPNPLAMVLPDRLALPDQVPGEPQAGGELDSALVAGVPAKPAVYVLLDQNDQPILLSSTANLRLGLLRRWAAPAATEGPSRRTNYRQISRAMAYRRVSSSFAANLWYLRAARLLYPNHYRKLLTWKPAWCITLNSAEAFPQFRAVAIASHAMDGGLGPFPDSASARLAVQVLEDTFDLCRYYEILRQAPHGKPCAYQQMGKCPAPCDGSISMEDYRRSLALAREFLVGRQAPSGVRPVPVQEARDHWRQAQEDHMRAAAMKLDFLAAARIKARIQSAGRLSGEKFVHVQPLQQMKFLIIQTGPTKSWVEPFFFLAGRIISGAAVRLRDLETALSEWCRRVATDMQVGEYVGDDPAEIMSLLGYHLFRSRDSGLYIPVDEALTVDTLRPRIQAWLAQKDPPADNMEQSSEAASAGGAGTAQLSEPLPMDRDQ